MKRFAILIAAAGSFALACGPAAAEGTSDSLPDCAPGQLPTLQSPCKLPPCADGQLPTPQAPCALNKPLPPCAEGQLPTAQSPCVLPLCPPDTQPSLDQPCRVEGQGLFPKIPGADDGPGDDSGGDNQGGDTQGGGDQGGDSHPSGDHHPAGDKLPAFGHGFLSRVWRFDAEADSYDATANVLNVTISEITNLPKKFASKDDAIIDQDADVLFANTTKVYDSDGHRVRSEADYNDLLDNANSVKVVGKLMPPSKWLKDADGVPVTSIRAKRVTVSG